MSLATVNKLYQELTTAAQTMAKESAPVSMITAFNTDLAHAQHRYPQHPILSTMTQAQAQIPILDLLTRTGRLQTVLEEEENKELAQKNRIRHQARRDQFRSG